MTIEHQPVVAALVGVYLHLSGCSLLAQGLAWGFHCSTADSTCAPVGTNPSDMKGIYNLDVLESGPFHF